MEPKLLQNHSTSELRSLLILKIRNFTDALEKGYPLVNLENMREEMRVIAEILKSKEMGDSQPCVERTTHLKAK